MSISKPLFASILASAIACAGHEASLDTGTEQDGSGQSTDTSETFCADAPLVTYANFGEAFLLTNCQVCHATTAADRHDAPGTVTFDTAGQAWDWADRILARSTGEDASMPPAGGVSEYDMDLLLYWLVCGEEGT